MTELIMKLAGSDHKAPHRPAFGYRLLVGGLFVLSAFAIIVARIFGEKARASLWQEAREAAHAVAGYAYKH